MVAMIDVVSCDARSTVRPCRSPGASVSAGDPRRRAHVVVRAGRRVALARRGRPRQDERDEDRGVRPQAAQDGARHDGEDHRQREQRHRPLAEVRGEPARLVADADVPEAEVENVLEDRSHARENRPIHAFSGATRLRDRPRW
jgi:hypothetical protein